MKYFYNYPDDLSELSSYEECAVLVKAVQPTHYRFIIRFFKNGKDHREEGPSYIDVLASKDLHIFKNFTHKAWFLEGKLLFSSEALKEWGIKEPHTLNDIKKICCLL